MPDNKYSIVSNADISFNTPKGYQNQQKQLGNTGFGKSRYDLEGNIYVEDTPDLNEVRAQRQSTIEKLSLGVPRALGKATTELLKTPGYLYGLGEAALTDKSIGESLDNKYINTFENLDQSIKENLPVYVPKAVKEGNVIKNLGSSSFWATEGADGVGFMISMLLPGQVAKMAKLGRLTELGVNTASRLDSRIGNVKLFAKEAGAFTDELTAATTNAALEASSESLDTYHQVLEKTGGDKVKAGEAAADVFKGNMALLVVPNLINQYKLFGTFKNQAKESALNRLFDKSGALLEDAAPLTKAELFKRYGKEVSSAFLREGAFEEGIQYALQKEAIDGEHNNLFDKTLGVAEQYLKGLGDTEFQKAVMLGGILGSPIGVISAHKEGKAEDKVLFGDKDNKGLKDLLKSNFTDRYKNFNQIYDTTDDGQLKVNPSKLEEFKKNILNKSVTETIKDQAIKNNDKETYNLFKDLEDFKYFLPYFQTEGGLEVLKQHINTLSEQDKKYQEDALGVIDDKNAIQTKFELQHKADTFKKIYDNVITESSTPGIKYIPDQEQDYKDFTNSVINSKIQQAVVQHNLGNTINHLQLEITELEASPIYQNKKLAEKKTKTLEIVKSNLEESYKLSKQLEDTKDLQETFDTYIASIPIVEEKPIETPTEVVSKEPIISDEDFTTFTNTGEVKPEHLELLADKVQSKVAFTEREQAVYTAKSKEIENILKQRVIEDKKKSTITENPEHQDSEGVVEDYKAQAQTPFKTAGKHLLEDNLTINPDLNQQRWFNYLQDTIAPGYKLLTVTPFNNSELFNELVSEDAYKIGGSKFEPGIFVVVVDEKNNIVKIDSKPVFTTLEKTIEIDRLSANRRAKTEGITVEESEKLINQEIKDLAILRKQILDSKESLYLGGLQQEFGPRQVERNGNDRIKGSPKGRITNNINHLSLEVGKSTTSKHAILSNGTKVYSGKLYVIDRTTNRTYDLNARTLNESEVNLAFKLIENLVNGKSSNTKENPKTILENLIYLRADNPNELYKIDLVKDGKKYNLLIGDTTFTTIDESNSQMIKDFLATKFIQFNANINPDEKYTEYKIDSEGKIFTKEWNSYKEYITDNDDIPFSTDVAKIEEGKPRFINPYLTFEVKPIKSEIKESELEEGDDNNPFTDYETQPEEGVVIPKEPKKFTKKEVVIDPSTLNRLALDKIGKLITKEEKQWFKEATGLDYEEVDGLIEGKSLGQVTEAGKVLLSNKATSGTLLHEAFHTITQFVLSNKQVDSLYKEAREKFSKKSDAEIEEILAEDFINYATTGKVLEERPKRNTVFRKILNLLKKLVGIDTTTIEEVYSKLYKGQYKNTKRLGTKRLLSIPLSRTKALKQDYSFDKDVMDGITALFTDSLLENGFTPNDLQKYKNLQSKIQDLAYNKIFEQYETGNLELEYILSEWDSLIIPRFDEKIKQFNLKYSNKVKNIEDKEHEGDLQSVNEDEETTIVEGKRSGDSFKEANQESTKDNMNGTTKWLIASLPQVDKQGKREYNELGLPKLVDFNKTYGQLLNELTGLNTFEEIYSKLQSLSTTKPNYIELAKRIKNPSANLNVEQLLLQRQFRQDFAKNKTESYITKIEADGNIYTISANKSGLEEKIKTKWQYNMRGASKYIIEKDGKLIVDKDITKIDNPINFLKALGIAFGNDTFKYLRDNKFAVPALNNAVNYIKQEIEASEDGIVDLYSKDSNVTGRMNDLAELEGEYSDETIEHSFQSVEGKTIYEISLNNFLTLSKNIINNATNRDELFAKLPHLNTIYNQNSLWLKSMFTENGERRVIGGKPVILNVDLLNGLKSGDDGLPTAKLTTGDKIVQEINNTLLTGKTAYLRAADAASEHSISLSQFPSNRTDKKVLPVTIDSVDKGFDTPEIKKIFTGYILDEINTIRAFNTQGLGKDIDVYNKQGSKFRIFDGILTSSRSKVEVLLEQDVNAAIPLDILEAVNKDVITFLNNYYNETVTFINTNKADNISLKLTDKYNKTQLIRAFVVNDFISSIEQVKLFTGDISFYKDFYKRTKAGTGTKKFAENSPSLNVQINNVFKRQDGKVADGFINVAVFNDSKQSSNYLKEYTDILVAKGFTKEEAESILEPYTKMDEGDAQGWITLDEWREFMFRVGDIKPKQLALLDKIQKGTELTKEDIYTIQTLKAQYFGPQVKNNLFAPAYHKFSLMPLIPSLIKGTNLEKLNDTLKKQQIGYALFKSGSKVGTVVNSKGKANNFYTEETKGDITSNIDMVQRVPYEYLGIQLDISPDLKDKVIFGTQFRKLILSNLFDNGVANSTKFKELVEEYNSIISQYTARKEQGLREKLGIKNNDYSHKDIFKLVETLQKEAEERNLPDNLIDALQAQIVEGKVMLKYPIDALVTKSKVEAMLMSLINSNIIRQKVSGDAMIQGASSGFEKLGSRVEGSNELKFYRESKDGNTLPMEIKVPFSSHYRDLLNKYKTIEGVNQAIKDGSIDKRLVELVGYRIPTQGLNSIEYMTITEFLPEESGNLIILPTEIVAKSGGDYDIDKLNVIRPTITPEGEYEEYTGEKASNGQLINRLVEISKDITSDSENFVNLITPNSVNNLKRLVQEIRELKGEAKEPTVKSQTELLKFKYKVEQFNNFLSGKAGVGISAVQNTNHIIYQLSGAKVSKQYIDNIYMEIKGNGNLGNITNLNGTKISELISEFINAYVDIAKDPFVFDLNATTEAAGVWFYLTRLGADFNTIAYFMNQPIITEYLKAKSVNNSLVVKNSSQFLQRKQLEEQVKRKYIKHVNPEEKTEFKVYDTKDNDTLKEYIKGKDNSQEFYRAQLQFLDNYLEYSEQSRLLSDVAQALNMDTAGVGKNLDASEDKKNLFEKVDASNFISNWRDVFNTTFLKVFDKHDFSIKAYNDLFFSSRPDINIYLRDVIDSIPTFKTIDKDKVTSLVRNDFINYLLQNYGTSDGKLLNEYKDILFKGENSLAKRLIKLKQKENKTPQEQEILDNKFVQELFPLLNQGFKKTDNIKIFTKRLDTFTYNLFTEEFRKLKDISPETYNNLVRLGVLQSGLNNSPITYLGLIPYESYGDLVNNAIDNFDKKNGVDDLYKFKQLFYRNNYKGVLTGFGGKSNEYTKFDKKSNQWSVGTNLGNYMFGKDYNLAKYNTSDVDVILSVEDRKSKDVIKAKKGVLLERLEKLGDAQEVTLEKHNIITELQKEGLITKKEINGEYRIPSITDENYNPKHNIKALKALTDYLELHQIDWITIEEIKAKNHPIIIKFNKSETIQTKIDYNIDEGDTSEESATPSSTEVDLQTLNNNLTFENKTQIKQWITDIEDGVYEGMIKDEDSLIQEFKDVKSSDDLAKLLKKICG